MPSFLDYTTIKNIKDAEFGGGATGDGVADDTAAIQTAVDYATSPFSANNRGTVFFPVGTYKITSAITFALADSVRSIGFVGAHGARINGNFDGPLLKRVDDDYIAAVCSIESLQLYNSHATGGGIDFSSLVGGLISNCEINAWRGIQLISSGIAIVGCNIIAPSASATSIGIASESNGLAVVGCDITGYGNGIRHSSIGLDVSGCRIEVCDVGVRMGVKIDGTTATSSGKVSGLSMESNDIAFEVVTATGFDISGCAITNNGTGTHAVKVATSDCFSMNGVLITNAGSWGTAAIELDNVKMGTFTSVIVGGGGTKFILPAGNQKCGLRFINTRDVPDYSVTIAELVAFEGTDASALPPGHTLRISNANAATGLLNLGSTGANDVMAMKVNNGGWLALGPGTA